MAAPDAWRPNVLPVVKIAPADVIQNPSLIQIPQNAFILQESHAGTNGRFILHIQDAHTNLSGQQNLARGLENLATRYGWGLVLVEGADRDVTLDDVKPLAGTEDWQRIARRFLMQGKIAGEEYLNLTTDLPLRLVGVEDAPLYRKALSAYARLTARRQKIQKYLHRVRVSLERAKGRFYPKEMLEWERQSDADTVPFEQKVGRLLDEADRSGVDRGDLAAVTHYGVLRADEKRVDFDAASQELLALRRDLAASTRGKSSGKKRSVIEPPALPNPSHAPAAPATLASARTETMLVVEEAKRAGISLAPYPHFAAYAAHMEEAGRLDFQKLLEGSDILEARWYEQALKSNEARTLRAIDRHLRLLEKAYRLNLSASEHRRLVGEEPDFGILPWLAYLNRRLLDLGYAEDLVPTDGIVRRMRRAREAFYSAVEERDQAFVRNAGKALDASGSKAAFLIAGGYHTENLTRLLREEGYGYVVLTPVITDETDHALYEKILLAELKNPVRAETRVALGTPGKTEEPASTASTIRPVAISLSSARLTELKDAARSMARDLAPSPLIASHSLSAARLADGGELEREGQIYQGRHLRLADAPSKIGPMIENLRADGLTSFDKRFSSLSSSPGDSAQNKVLMVLNYESADRIEFLTASPAWDDHLATFYHQDLLGSRSNAVRATLVYDLRAKLPLQVNVYPRPNQSEETTRQDYLRTMRLFAQSLTVQYGPEAIRGILVNSYRSLFASNQVLADTELVDKHLLTEVLAVAERKISGAGSRVRPDSGTSGARITESKKRTSWVWWVLARINKIKKAPKKIIAYLLRLKDPTEKLGDPQTYFQFIEDKIRELPEDKGSLLTKIDRATVLLEIPAWTLRVGGMLAGILYGVAVDPVVGSFGVGFSFIGPFSFIRAAGLLVLKVGSVFIRSLRGVIGFRALFVSVLPIIGGPASMFLMVSKATEFKLNEVLHLMDIAEEKIAEAAKKIYEDPQTDESEKDLARFMNAQAYDIAEAIVLYQKRKLGKDNSSLRSKIRGAIHYVVLNLRFLPRITGLALNDYFGDAGAKFRIRRAQRTTEIAEKNPYNGKIYYHLNPEKTFSYLGSGKSFLYLGDDEDYRELRIELETLLRDESVLRKFYIFDFKEFREFLALKERVEALKESHRSAFATKTLSRRNTLSALAEATLQLHEVPERDRRAIQKMLQHEWTGRKDAWYLRPLGSSEESNGITRIYEGYYKKFNRYLGYVESAVPAKSPSRTSGARLAKNEQPGRPKLPKGWAAVLEGFEGELVLIDSLEHQVDVLKRWVGLGITMEDLDEWMESFHSLYETLRIQARMRRHTIVTETTVARVAEALRTLKRIAELRTFDQDEARKRRLRELLNNPGVFRSTAKMEAQNFITEWGHALRIQGFEGRLTEMIQQGLDQNYRAAEWALLDLAGSLDPSSEADVADQAVKMAGKILRAFAFVIVESEELLLDRMSLNEGSVTDEDRRVVDAILWEATGKFLDVITGLSEESKSRLRKWPQLARYLAGARLAQSLIKSGPNVVNAVFVSHDPARNNIRALMQEAAARRNLNLIRIDPGTSPFQLLDVNGRWVPAVTTGYVYADGKENLIDFRRVYGKPLAVHYLVSPPAIKDAFFQKLAASGIPFAGDPGMRPVFDEKDLSITLLNGDPEIRIPKSELILVHDALTNPALRELRRAEASSRPGWVMSPFDRDPATLVPRTRKALRQFLSQNHLEKAVAKPNDGSQGQNVIYFDETNLDEAALTLSSVLRADGNVLLQERIVPPLFSKDGKAIDWNLRVFVSRDESENWRVGDVVARVGPYGDVINISLGAEKMHLDDLTRFLNLSTEESAAFLSRIQSFSTKVADELESSLRKRGILGASEHTTDFMGLDIMVRSERGGFTPYLIEINGFNSGGMWQKGEVTDEESGKSVRDWLNLMERRGLAYKQDLPWEYDTYAIDGARLAQTARLKDFNEIDAPEDTRILREDHKIARVKPVTGYRRLVQDSDFQRIGNLFEAKGLGFILENHVGYTRTQLDDANSVYPVRNSQIIKNENDRIRLWSNVWVPDFSPKITPDRALADLDMGFYLRMLSHLQHERKRIDRWNATALRFHIEQLRKKLRVPLNDETLRRVMSAGILHEISEAIWVLMDAKKESNPDAKRLSDWWDRYHANPGTERYLRPRGFFYVKDVLKQAFDPKDWFFTNIFADKFALYLDDESVFKDLGETLTPEERAFFDEVVRFVREEETKGGAFSVQRSAGARLAVITDQQREFFLNELDLLIAQIHQILRKTSAQQGDLKASAQNLRWIERTLLLARSEIAQDHYRLHSVQLFLAAFEMLLSERDLLPDPKDHPESYGLSRFSTLIEKMAPTFAGSDRSGGNALSAYVLAKMAYLRLKEVKQTLSDVQSGTRDFDRVVTLKMEQLLNDPKEIGHELNYFSQALKRAMENQNHTFMETVAKNWVLKIPGWNEQIGDIMMNVGVLLEDDPFSEDRLHGLLRDDSDLSEAMRHLKKAREDLNEYLSKRGISSASRKSGESAGARLSDSEALLKEFASLSEKYPKAWEHLMNTFVRPTANLTLRDLNRAVDDPDGPVGYLADLGWRLARLNRMVKHQSWTDYGFKDELKANRRSLEYLLNRLMDWAVLMKIRLFDPHGIGATLELRKLQAEIKLKIIPDFLQLVRQTSAGLDYEAAFRLHVDLAADQLYDAQSFYEEGRAADDPYGFVKEMEEQDGIVPALKQEAGILSDAPAARLLRNRYDFRVLLDEMKFYRDSRDPIDPARAAELIRDWVSRIERLQMLVSKTRMQVHIKNFILSPRGHIPLSIEYLEDFLTHGPKAKLADGGSDAPDTESAGARMAGKHRDPAEELERVEKIYERFLEKAFPQKMRDRYEGYDGDDLDMVIKLRLASEAFSAKIISEFSQNHFERVGEQRQANNRLPLLLELRVNTALYTYLHGLIENDPAPGKPSYQKVSDRLSTAVGVDVLHNDVDEFELDFLLADIKTAFLREDLARHPEFEELINQKMRLFIEEEEESIQMNYSDVGDSESKLNSHSQSYALRLGGLMAFNQTLMRMTRFLNRTHAGNEALVEAAFTRAFENYYEGWLPGSGARLASTEEMRVALDQFLIDQLQKPYTAVTLTLLKPFFPQIHARIQELLQSWAVYQESVDHQEALNVALELFSEFLNVFGIMQNLKIDFRQIQESRDTFSNTFVRTMSRWLRQYDFKSPSAPRGKSKKAAVDRLKDRFGSFMADLAIGKEDFNQFKADHPAWFAGTQDKRQGARLASSPVRILLADKPQREHIPSDIQSLIRSLNLEGEVELIDEVGEAGNQKRLRELIQKHRPAVVIVFQGKKAFIDPYTVQAASQNGVKAVIRAGAGYDNISVENMTRYGVPFLRSHGLKHSMADFATRLLFAALRRENGAADFSSAFGGFDEDRNIDVADNPAFSSILRQSPRAYLEALEEAIRRNRGQMTDAQKNLLFSPLSGEEMLNLAKTLEGKRVGILGFGVIGQEFARRLLALKAMSGVSFDLIAASPSSLNAQSPEAAIAADLGVQIVGEEELFETADVLSVQIPSTDANKKYVEPGKFAQRTKPLILINTARRDIVDDAMFGEELPFKTAYFGDVDFDPALLALRDDPRKNVFVAPHIGGLTGLSAQGATEGMLQALKDVLPILLGRPDAKPVKTINGIPVTPISRGRLVDEYLKKLYQMSDVEMEAFEEQGIPDKQLRIRKWIDANGDFIPSELVLLAHDLRDSPEVDRRITSIVDRFMRKLPDNLSSQLFARPEGSRHLSIVVGEPPLNRNFVDVITEQVKQASAIRGSVGKFMLFPGGVIVLSFEPSGDEDLKSINGLVKGVVSQAPGFFDYRPFARHHITAFMIKNPIQSKEDRAALVGALKEMNLELEREPTFEWKISKLRLEKRKGLIGVEREIRSFDLASSDGIHSAKSDGSHSAGARLAQNAPEREDYLQSMLAYVNFLSEERKTAGYKADGPRVHLLLGTHDAYTYERFARRYLKEGFDWPIVISGGIGRETAPLKEQLRKDYLEGKGKLFKNPDLIEKLETLLNAKNADEASLIGILLEMEGISKTTADGKNRIYLEKESTNTAQNFVKAEAQIDAAAREWGFEGPAQIEIWTHLGHGLRAFLTGLTKLRAKIQSGWGLKFERSYDPAEVFDTTDGRAAYDPDRLARFSEFFHGKVGEGDETRRIIDYGSKTPADLDIEFFNGLQSEWKDPARVDALKRQYARWSGAQPPQAAGYNITLTRLNEEGSRWKAHSEKRGDLNVRIEMVDDSTSRHRLEEGYVLLKSFHDARLLTLSREELDRELPASVFMDRDDYHSAFAVDESSGAVIGVYTYMPAISRLNAIKVHPDYLGSGVADVLLKHLERYAAKVDPKFVKTGRINVQVARQKPGVRQGIFNVTFDKLKEVLGIRSRVTMVPAVSPSAENAGARLAVNALLKDRLKNEFDVEVSADGRINLDRVPDDAAWVMDEWRPEYRAPIIEDVESLPVVELEYPYDESPKVANRPSYKAQVYLDLIRRNGSSVPAVIKIFGPRADDAFVGTRDASIQHELKFAQVLDRLGVGPVFYGTVTDSEGRIVGYAIQLIIGNLAMPGDLYDEGRDADESYLFLTQRFFEIGLNPFTDIMVTRKNRLAVIDAGGIQIMHDRADAGQLFQAYLEANNQDPDAGARLADLRQQAETIIWNGEKNFDARAAKNFLQALLKDKPTLSRVKSMQGLSAAQIRIVLAGVEKFKPRVISIAGSLIGGPIQRSQKTAPRDTGPRAEPQAEIPASNEKAGFAAKYADPRSQVRQLIDNKNDPLRFLAGEMWIEYFEFSKQLGFFQWAAGKKLYSHSSANRETKSRGLRWVTPMDAVTSAMEPSDIFWTELKAWARNAYEDKKSNSVLLARTAAWLFYNAAERAIWFLSDGQKGLSLSGYNRFNLGEPLSRDFYDRQANEIFLTMRKNFEGLYPDVFVGVRINDEPVLVEAVGNDLWKGLDLKDDDRSVVLLFRAIAEWLEKNNYPHMDVVWNYLARIEKNIAQGVLQPKRLPSLVFKDIDALTGETKVGMDVRAVLQYAKFVLRTESQDLFIKYLASVMVREAWGVKLFDEQSKKFLADHERYALFERTANQLGARLASESEESAQFRGLQYLSQDSDARLVEFVENNAATSEVNLPKKQAMPQSLAGEDLELALARGPKGARIAMQSQEKPDEYYSYLVAGDEVEFFGEGKTVAFRLSEVLTGARDEEDAIGRVAALVGRSGEETVSAKRAAGAAAILAQYAQDRRSDVSVPVAVEWDASGLWSDDADLQKLALKMLEGHLKMLLASQESFTEQKNRIQLSVRLPQTALDAIRQSDRKLWEDVLRLNAASDGFTARNPGALKLALVPDGGVEAADGVKPLVYRSLGKDDSLGRDDWADLAQGRVPVLNLSPLIVQGASAARVLESGYDLADHPIVRLINHGRESTDRVDASEVARFMNGELILASRVALRFLKPVSIGDFLDFTAKVHTLIQTSA